MSDMLRHYDSDKDGCQAFIDWIASQATKAAAWEHIDPSDEADLRKAISFLGHDPVGALSRGDLNYSALWRLVGAAFMIGRSGGISKSDAAYRKHVAWPKEQRNRKAAKRRKDPSQIVIEDTVREMKASWDGKVPNALAAKISDKLAMVGIELSPTAIVKRLKKPQTS